MAPLTPESGLTTEAVVEGISGEESTGTEVLEGDQATV